MVGYKEIQMFWQVVQNVPEWAATFGPNTHPWWCIIVRLKGVENEKKRGNVAFSSTVKSFQNKDRLIDLLQLHI